MSNGSDTTYTISIAGKVITLTPSTGTAQTITIPDDLDMGFDSSGADEDKELRFIVQELSPSGKRDFSVTLASTGSSSERRYSFMKGAGTGSITSSTDPDGIVRSVAYIGSGATVFPRAERRKFRFQFGEPARKNRSLAGAKLVVNGTEHDLEDWGISSDRRYREVRTSDAVSYRYRSGSAVTFNLKFADGTYLGYTSETKATRTLLKEDMKGALGITDVRENVTSVLQDVTDATATTSGEVAVIVSVPFDFHTVYDDAGMSPVYDAAAKRISFGGLSNSERTSVVVRSNVRLRHNGGECSVELSLREFRGASETNKWVLARKDLEEHGTLFAFDLAGESVEAEMSGGRYYRFDIDVKRSGDENATAGVHGTSAHVINFASFERVEGDRRWSPRENLAWPPNQASSVRLTYGDRGSGLKTTGYFFGDDEAEAEVPFSREWKGVIDAGNARVEFDVSYSGKSGSLRSPYDFKVAGSWILSDGTVSDWEKKVEVSTTASSGSQSLLFTPPSTATGMYLRYLRETNTFTGSSDEITFAAGDPVIRYVSGGGLTQAQVDARVTAGVQDWAEAGSKTRLVESKLPAKLDDFLDASSDGGWKDEGASAVDNIWVSTTRPTATKPSLVTATGYTYAQTLQIAPAVSNVYHAIRVPNDYDTDDTELRYAVFETGDLPEYSYAFSAWEFLGTSGGMSYYVVHIPAADNIAPGNIVRVQNYKPFTIDGDKVSLDPAPGGLVKSVAEPFEISDAGQLTFAPEGTASAAEIADGDGFVMREGSAPQDVYTAGLPFVKDKLGIELAGISNVEIHRGAMTGRTIPNSGNDYYSTVGHFDTTPDLDAEPYAHGIFLVSVDISFVSRSVASIGYGTDRDDTATLSGFVTSTKIAAGTTYDAARLGTAGARVDSVDIYNGNVKVGVLTLRFARDGANRVYYYFHYDGLAASVNFNFAASGTVDFDPDSVPRSQPHASNGSHLIVASRTALPSPGTQPLDQIAVVRGDPGHGIYVREQDTASGNGGDTGLGTGYALTQANLSSVALSAYTYEYVSRVSIQTTHGTLPATAIPAGFPEELTYFYLRYVTANKTSGVVEMKFASGVTYTGKIRVVAGGSGNIDMNRVSGTTWKRDALAANVMTQLAANAITISAPDAADIVTPKWTPAVGTKTLLANLPAVGSYTEGESVYVTRGTGANQKIWEYTILGAGASRKWVKTAGDKVVLGTANVDVVTANIAYDTGIGIPTWADILVANIDGDNVNSTYTLTFRKQAWDNLTAVAVGTDIVHHTDYSLNFYRLRNINLDKSIHLGRGTNGNLLYASRTTPSEIDAEPLYLYAF